MDTISPPRGAAVIDSLLTVTGALQDDKRSDLEMQRVTGVSAKTISKMRAGNYRPKTIQNLIAVERALGLAASQSEAQP